MAEAAVPKFYDITTDELRPVTQADVDQMVGIVQAYGMLRKGACALLDVAHMVAKGGQVPTDIVSRIIKGD